MAFSAGHQDNNINITQVEHTDEYTLMCGKCIAVLNEFHDMYSLVSEFRLSRSSTLHNSRLISLSP